MRKKKILYFMHLDWKWSKQRPHFIAEGLSDFFDIKVIYMVSKQFISKNSSISTSNKKNLDLSPIFRMPFYENKFIYNLNKFFIKVYLKFLIKKYNPDFLWITFPQLYDYIPLDCQCKVVYDCMDLATAFDFDDKFKLKITENEERIIADSSIIFVSSDYLFKTLKEKYHCEDKLIMVRNAFGEKFVKDKSNINLFEKINENYKIGFFGTITNKLIDFPMIKFTLDNINCIEYHFIGPVNADVKFKHDRVKFYGIMNYDKIKDSVKDLDCFILPLKVDSFRRASDPVKVYEYIKYNKPIISIYYEGLQYFSKFLYFYSNANDLLDVLNQMIANGFVRKYSSEDRIEFLNNNCWDVRVKKIIEFLEDLK